MPRTPAETEVLIIGAGFGGVGAAIELRRHGFEKVTILDAAEGVGGTWLYNSYPGAACDVPSHLYSYSYATRTDWSRICSPRDEILNYIRGVARDFGIEALVVPNTRVAECRWAEAERRWEVRSEDGREWRPHAIVIATGQLNQPALPRIRGLEDFDGHTFHSARWDHDYDMRGKRVAVIGTGASAVQFVPEIADQVARLDVYQRTGNWFLPRKNHPYPGWLKAIFRFVPGVQALRRRFIFNYGESLTFLIRNPRTWGRIGHLRSSLFMRWQLRGHPVLRRKIWPDYTFGCKRILFSSYWLPALTRPNVELHTERITRLVASGVETEDGVIREADCIIFGTGFRTNDFMFPMEIVGAGGRPLTEAWANGARAHLGMTVSGFPSMFVMYGPNTNTSGGSIIWYLEQQSSYIRQALQETVRREAAAITVRPEAEERSDREVQAAFEGTAWTACDSWYRDSDAGGRIVANWPLYMRDYGERTSELDPAEFEFIP